MRDHVVQLTGDARPLPAGRVLHQGAGDDLPGRYCAPAPRCAPAARSRSGPPPGPARPAARPGRLPRSPRAAVPASASTRNGTAKAGARNWAAPHEASVRRLLLHAAPLRPSRYRAISSAARPATVSVWKAASESTLAAQIATAAATGPRKASGTVVRAASAHTPTRPAALIPVPAPRATASVIAASPSRAPATAGACGRRGEPPAPFRPSAAPVTCRAHVNHCRRSAWA